MSFPLHRPRRLRRSAAMRRLVAETRLHPAELILPAFIKEGAAEPVPIASMPGVVQHTLDSLVDVSKQARDAGVAGVMLFGVPETKDAQGSGSIDPDGILNVATEAIAAEVWSISSTVAAMPTIASTVCRVEAWIADLWG